MGANLPRISEQWVYGGDVPSGCVQLDSAAWFGWLAAETTTRLAGLTRPGRHGDALPTSRAGSAVSGLWLAVLLTFPVQAFMPKTLSSAPWRSAST